MRVVTARCIRLGQCWASSRACQWWLARRLQSVALHEMRLLHFVFCWTDMAPEVLQRMPVEYHGGPADVVRTKT
jgi:hypothetical protein